MANSPREFKDKATQLQSTPSFLASPTSCVNSNSSSIVTSSDGIGFYHHNHHHDSNPSTPRTPPSQSITRSEPTTTTNNPYPTTFVQADTCSFKQVVQMLTGSTQTTKQPSSQSTPRSSDPNSSTSHPPRNHHHHHHQIPPIRPVSKPKPSRLLERRNSQKALKLSPLIPSLSSTPSPNHHFSPRPPEILSPSILDFPSLILSPVTPLIHDPFNKSSYPGLTRCAPQISLTADRLAEEKAIAEKGFYLHRSPATTPRGLSEPPPRLLPLFPVTSPKSSGSSDD